MSSSMVETTSVVMEEKLSFETGVERLEQIVRALEQKDVPLDNALSLFREGVELVQHCTNLLDQAEKQMEILLESDGELRVEPATFSGEG